MSEKTVFIDRDGVINKDPGGWTKYDYVTNWGEFRFLPGVFKAMKALKDNGYEAIIISNQAGVGKGYFSAEDLKSVDKGMADEIRKNGGEVSASYYCVHTDEEDCLCRKPKTGLFDKAKKEHKIGHSNTCFIGDTERDMAAGHRAGLKTILVLSGKAGREEVKGWKEKPDHIFSGLLEAVEWLIKGGSKV